MAQLKDTLIQGSARVTDTLYANLINGLTLTAVTTGFTIAGGTTSKTLTVNESITLKAGAANKVAFYSTANTLEGCTNFYTDIVNGTTTTNGKMEVILGNATATGSTGNAKGVLSIFSSGSKGTYIDAAANSTDWYGATLQAASGTIAYLSDITSALNGATLSAPTQWGIVYGGASGAYASTAAGTSGQYLKSNGSAAPTWANLPNYDDTYVNVSGDTMTGDLTVPTIISKVTQSYASSNPVIKMIHHNNSTDQDVEDAYIGAGTGGSLGIASKVAIALWPGSTSATAAADFQSTQGIRFFKNRCEPCPNSTYSLGETNSRFTNVYATNLYGTLNTTDINGVDATNGSLEKTLNQKGNWVTNKRIFFGTCDTVAATTTKAVTCAEFSDDDLVDGTIISVRFTYQNSGAVGSLKLDVNSTGAYSIKKMYASTGLTNLTNAAELGANGVVTFVFSRISDTTAYWQVVGLDYNTNTDTYVTQDFSTATNYPRPLLLSNYTLGSTSTSAAIAYRNDQIYANAGLGALYATSFHGALDYNDLTHTNATAGQVLTVNSTADGLVWATPSTGVSLASQTTQVYLTGAAQTTDTSLQLTAAYVTTAGALYSTTVHNAVWNDYAEYRAAASYIEPGRVVIDTDNGEVILATKRLQPGAQVVSDTWGHIMGETNTAKTPLAVAGRVLVYPYKDRKEYHAGMCVCSAPNGTVDIMTRDEIKEYPDCIIGTVSEIPEYEYWGSGNVEINERIWVKVR